MSEVLVAGDAAGLVLSLTEPLSFWGGVQESTGKIIDTHHPQHGASITGKILVLPSARGSSSSSSVLAELIRGGVGPAAIVLGVRDPILALGAMVAEALYGRVVPVLVPDADDYARLASWTRARVGGVLGDALLLHNGAGTTE